MRGQHLITHGLSRTRTHRAWLKMKERCLNPRAVNYGRYGGAGVTVCAQWVASFEAFLSDMGICPPGLTLERRDNSKGYTPENCRWATHTEQANNKSTNRLVEFQGQTKSVAQWCRELRLNYHLVRQRIYRDRMEPLKAFEMAGVPKIV